MKICHDCMSIKVKRVNQVQEGKVKVDESKEAVFHVYIYGLIVEF